MYISLVKLKALDSYEQHKLIWTLFPNTPDRDRDHLFRVENEQHNQAVVLLQSSTRPQSSAGAEVMQTKQFDINLSNGWYFKFKLVANPTKRLRKERNVVELKDENEQVEWLQRKLDGANVTVTSMDSKIVTSKKAYNSLFVVFEGILQVTDVEKVQRLIVMGVGRKKHAGAGLLSLAKVN